MTDQPEHSELPESGPSRLTIGKIVAPHGVRGEFRMVVYTHFPERIAELPHIYIGDDENPHQVRRSRLQGNLAIIRVDGITSREEVDERRNQLVRIDLEHAAPLEEGEHYYFEIVGLKAVDEAGNTLGTVADIIETGANDVYIIRDDEGNEMLVPALLDVVPEIDIEAGRMVVRPLRYSDEA